MSVLISELVPQDRSTTPGQKLKNGGAIFLSWPLFSFFLGVMSKLSEVLPDISEGHAEIRVLKLNRMPSKALVITNGCLGAVFYGVY